MTLAATRFDVGEQTVKRVARHLLPFLFLAYVTNYLDRANVAYAALQMSLDLRFSDRVFGLGAGIFFLGYVLLQIPGALLVERWSARRCISGTMIIWGMTTVSLAFIKTPHQFYASRFVIGLAEAGFFPGIIVYLSHWVNYRDRALATAHFMAAIPISFVVASPLAAWLLSVHWLGVRGWRWIFIGEGIPAVIFGLIAMFYLSDRPDQVHWLAPGERAWLVTMLEREKQLKKRTRDCTWWQAMGQRDVILLALVVFFAYTGHYGLIFWLPTILKRLSGFPDFKVALISALPYIAGFLAMVWCGWHSDRSGERRWHAAVPLFVGGASLLASREAGASLGFTLAAFTGALMGCYGFLACFWAMPSALLSESAAAAAIGVINLIGSIGGFVGPYLVGYLRTRSGSFAVPLGILGAAMLIAGSLATMPRVPRTSELTSDLVESHSQPAS
jgi:MFS transporter, ACS family, tartrate transporter